MHETLTQAEIDMLNKRALAIRTAQSDGDRLDSVGVVAALEQAASEAGLIYVMTDDYVVLYRDTSGRLVNCWLYGAMSYEIEDGGAGFDDQIDLFIDRFNDDEEENSKCLA